MTLLRYLMRSTCTCSCASGEHTLVANAGEPIPNSRNDNGGKVHDRHDAQNNQDALLCGLHTLVTKEESLVDVPDHHDDCNRGKDCLEQVINALSTS